MSRQPDAGLAGCILQGLVGPPASGVSLTRKKTNGLIKTFSAVADASRCAKRDQVHQTLAVWGSKAAKLGLGIGEEPANLAQKAEALMLLHAANYHARLGGVSLAFIEVK